MRRQHRSRRLRSRFASRISGLSQAFGGLSTTVVVVMGALGCMLVKDVSDGRRKLVSEIRGGGSRMSVENRRKDVIFKSLGINVIIISVANDGALSWRSGMRGKFESNGFVVR